MLYACTKYFSCLRGCTKYASCFVFMITTDDMISHAFFEMI